MNEKPYFILVEGDLVNVAQVVRIEPIDKSIYFSFVESGQDYSIDLESGADVARVMTHISAAMVKMGIVQV